MAAKNSIGYAKLSHFVIKKAELSLLYALCATLMQELDKRGRFAKVSPKVKRSVFLSRPRDHKNVYPVLTGYNPVDNVVNIKY